MQRAVVGKPKQDRRIQKTQKLLHEALASLIRERQYDSITVRDILERANVGRSTFYMHFRDKDELLVSGLRERVRLAYRHSEVSGKGARETLGFSLPMFEHIHEHRHRGEAVRGPGAWAVVHGHLREEIAELIAAEVKAMNRRRPQTAVHLPLDLLVQHVASTFILVLTWWAEGKSTLTPREADALFRALIPWV